jgi:UDP:flavonoid glycosyltransferase YjiC (YdhE family)
MLALAQALEQRGHSALLACPESFGPWVRSLGIAHASLGEDLEAHLRASGGKLARSLSGMREYFAEQMLLQGPRLVELAQGSDALVGTAMAWMVKSAADKLGIAALGILPSSCIPSRLHPPPLIPFYGLPQWLNRWLWWLNDAAQDRLMGEPVNRARAMLGLPPIASFTRHLFKELPQVIAADAALLPEDPAWNGRYPYIGFAFLADSSPLEPALAAWLDAGEPPVYVGFGSMGVSVPERCARHVCEALLRVGRRCVLFGELAAALPELAAPEQFFVAKNVPHAALFPRCAVAVHHGGAGTMAAALRAGVPQVVLPVMLDQFHHAHHLVRARLAVPASRLSRVSAAGLADAIKRAHALPVEPRLAFAARLQQGGAGDLFVERLQQLVAAG